MLPTPSQPVPCSTAKVDISPNDWSESNDNEDSLEQPDNKDPDSIQKDLSPTIFEMTPITEDSLCVNTYEDAPVLANENKPIDSEDCNKTPEKSTLLSNTVFVTSTPHNSIMSLNVRIMKQLDSDDSKMNSSLSGPESFGSLKKVQKYNESSPIVSGGASIDDYLPQVGSHSDSPVPRRRIENIPIVSGAYIQPVEEDNNRKSPKSSSAAAWVVDMSMSPKIDDKKNTSSTQGNYKKIGESACNSLKYDSNCSSISDNINKSPSSLNIDSERSSKKFYIDLSSLPDSIPPKNESEIESSIEKKNMFSMYIDLSEKSTLKEMPARLSLNSKKNNIEVKTKTVASKAIKGSATNTSALVPIKIDSGSPETFEKYESLCNDLKISISEIIRPPETKQKSNSTEVISSGASDPIKKERPSRVPGVDKTSFQRDDVIHEEHAGDQSGDLFVKLSDLDRPAPKTDTPSITTVYEETVSDVRMTRSIPDNNWGNQSTSRPMDVISSFHSENALSLNRLFPHLKNEFSKSMPGSLSSKGRPRAASSRGETDEPASDVSELSSVQSSMCRSVVGKYHLA